jgi:hypothetical protein
LSLLLTLASVLFLVVIGAAAIGVVRRQRGRLAAGMPGQVLQAGADGVIVVPILAANIGGRGIFGGMANNSINPTLALTSEGLTFKVLRQDHWTYAQLTGVNAGKGLLGATLEFNAAHASLNVTVRDAAMARQVLVALPRTVQLSAKAAALRDDATA